MKTTETEKYPPNIQKLFAPRLPLVYKPPLDYLPEKRNTGNVSSISQWKGKINEYLNEHHAKSDNITKGENEDISPRRRKLEKQKRKKESFERQLEEWYNPGSDPVQDSEMMGDPYKTVFIARVDYSLRELDISKHFSKYGVISSIRIVRDRTLGKSRGYGFIMFERENDAKNCIRELAPSGLKIPIQGRSSSRTILVDIERGRVMKHWRPRRLGGGLGGRHYTKTNPYFSNNASAAASGRRNFLESTPDFSTSHSQKSHFATKKHIPQRGQPRYQNYNTEGSPMSSSSYSSYYSSVRKGENVAVRDKYAKYNTRQEQQSSYQPHSKNNRSIRNIRQKY